jgi:hypothetical protein
MPLNGQNNHLLLPAPAVIPFQVDVPAFYAVSAKSVRIASHSIDYHSINA